MNAPERHRSYQLGEGQARMTYEPDQRVASAGTCVEINQCVGWRTTRRFSTNTPSNFDFHTGGHVHD